MTSRDEEQELFYQGRSAEEVKCGYIEHHVSKLDTLAGIAIKYGVEVADIKRGNGLVTDLQMFAHKTLKIPLHGRHLPTISSTLDSQGCSPPPRLGKHIISLPSPSREASSNNLVKRPVSSSIHLLRGYYGLSSSTQSVTEGMEMTPCKSVSDQQSVADFNNWPSFKSKDQSVRKKATSNGGGMQEERGEINGASGDLDKCSERVVRRRAKAEGVGVFSVNADGGGVIQEQAAAMMGKTPPRPKTSSRIPLIGTTDASYSVALPSAAESSPGLTARGLKTVGGGAKLDVRRSCSTSDLQDVKMQQQVDLGFKQASRPDLINNKTTFTTTSSNNNNNNNNQARFSSLGSLPLFDVISKPVGGRRNKAALD